VTEFITADGVIEAPGGGDDYRNAGWTFSAVEFDEAAYEIKAREQKEAGALLLGRKTYELFAPIWPTMDEFAEYNAMPRYVVSSTLERDDPQWPATILRNLDDVAALKQTDGGPLLVHGSAVLEANLADAGLVDRYHLLVFPVLAGAGTRLFSTTDKDLTKLRVAEHDVYSNGVVKLVYDVLR
jgi:dihydrofolate reductase